MNEHEDVFTGSYCGCGRVYSAMSHRCPATPAYKHNACLNAALLLKRPDLACISCREPWVEGAPLSAQHSFVSDHRTA